MAIYWYVYAILAIFSFCDIFSKLSKRTKKTIISLTLFFFAVLSSIYNGPCGDLYKYKEYFYYPISLQLTIFEPLYVYISSLVKTLTDSYSAFRFVIACIVMKLWYKILVERSACVYKDYSITILLILWALKEGHIFIIRSTIAVAIAIYSIRFIRERELKKFLITVLIMLGFHLMSIVWLPAYFVYYKNEYRKYYIYVAILFGIFHSRIAGLITGITSRIPGFYAIKITSYINKGMAGSTGGAAYDYNTLVLKGSANMILLIIIFLYVSYRKKQLAHQDEFEHMFNIYAFGAMLYVLSMSTAIALGRASLPYTTLQFIMLPYVFDLPEFKKNIAQKFTTYVCFMSYLTVRMIPQLTENMSFVTIFEK